MRLFSNSEASDSSTTGRPSTDSLSGGCGRDSRSLKNGDAMASTDLCTRKMTWSDDRIMRLASYTTKVSDGDVVVILWASETSRSWIRDRADFAYKGSFFKTLSSSVHQPHLRFRNCHRLQTLKLPKIPVWSRWVSMHIRN